MAAAAAAPASKEAVAGAAAGADADTDVPSQAMTAATADALSADEGVKVPVGAREVAVPNRAEDAAAGAAAVAAADVSEDEGEGEKQDGQPGGGGKKRRRNRRKKKAGAVAAAVAVPRHCVPEVDNSRFRLLGSWPAAAQSRFDFPPTVPVGRAFPDRAFPEGELCDYGCGPREERRAADALRAEDWNDMRHAAECHRQVRKFAQSYIEPGMKMIDICQRLEKKTLELVEAAGLERGFGFPTGCSLNNVAAHYTPNYGDDTVVQRGDIMKLDFGVHVNGRIVDCAFSVAFDPRFDSLIQASKDGTNAGIAAAGVDARFSEIGAAIQEAIEAYEFEEDGALKPIKAVANLNGHSIDRYLIHGGKSVPMVRNAFGTIMEEGEIYAIETFASTGKGYVTSSGECSHYMMREGVNPRAIGLRLQSAKALAATIEREFNTLPFCRRWLDDRGAPRHLMALKQLVDNGLVEPYPPLVDVKGSFVSQMEHTILLRPTCKEIVSRGDDF